ncbi:hypothetical protein V2J09_023669, partial [Rumex salicifolius]
FNLNLILPTSLRAAHRIPPILHFHSIKAAPPSSRCSGLRASTGASRFPPPFRTARTPEDDASHPVTSLEDEPLREPALNLHRGSSAPRWGKLISYIHHPKSSLPPPLRLVVTDPISRLSLHGTANIFAGYHLSSVPSVHVFLQPPLGGSFGGARGARPLPPEKGVFPLDHLHECDVEKISYLSCLKSEGHKSEKCRHLSKKYLECRMEKNLMAKQDLSELGFAKELDKEASDTLKADAGKEG